MTDDVAPPRRSDLPDEPGPLVGAEEPTIVAIAADWYSGPGAHGGLVAAHAARAALRLAPPEQDLRALSARFHTATTEGPLTLRADLERGSRRQTTVTVRAEQHGELRLAGTAVLGLATPDPAPGAEPDYVEPPASSSLPRPDDIEPQTRPTLVPFTQHFDYRWATPAPFGAPTGDPNPELAAWLRRRQPTAVDAIEAVLLLDVLPPSFFAVASAPAAVPSVDYTVRIVADLRRDPVTPGAWVLVRQRCRGALAGWSVDTAELLDESGRLLAVASQTRRILGPLPA